jgi:hypothetical protein
VRIYSRTELVVAAETARFGILFCSGRRARGSIGLLERSWRLGRLTCDAWSNVERWAD